METKKHFRNNNLRRTLFLLTICFFQLLCAKKEDFYLDKMMYIPVLKGDKCGYIDVDGNIKIPFNFEYAGFFSDNGLAPAIKDSLFGFIDRSGEWKIQPQFNFAFPFFEGFAKVTFNGNTNGFIKSDGTIAYVINDSLFHDVHFRYHNSTVEASTHFQRSYAVLDTQGVTLFEVEADDCLFLNENYFFLRYYSQRFDSIKIIDMKGVTVFKSDQFDWVSFSDKTYQVCCKTDSDGKCLLSPDFTVEDCYPPYLVIFGDLHDDRQSFKGCNSHLMCPLLPFTSYKISRIAPSVDRYGPALV